MMICPESFYEENLKGKSAAEIRAEIFRLRTRIGKMKSILEGNYRPEKLFCPSPLVQIGCYRMYLLRAQMALMEMGETYTPSIAEKKAREFDENVPFINKVVFCLGGYWNGYETRTYIIDGDKIRTCIEHSLIPTPLNVGDSEPPEMDKESFLFSLEELHIGEWRRRYDSDTLDGTQWNLDVYFSNGHRPVKIYGNNAYPYNFDRLLELLGMER